jgi:spore coat polysaccharide biosynthesis protein SpsF
MKKRVIMIIQARMGSSRLPGKSMMDLAGMPMVGRIIERVKRCKSLDDIVLAIPATADDVVLKELGESHGIKVFAGPENDLVERYYQAARPLKADVVVRLPADNATPEPTEIDRIVNFHLSLGKRGFSSNLSVIDDSGYPDGIGAEVFDFSLLGEVRENHSDLRKREHVHLNFFDYSNGQAVDEQWCPVNTIKCPEAYCRPDLILDVNTWEQYEFMRLLYEYIYPKNPNFHIADIINWYDTIYLPGHT